MYYLFILLSLLPTHQSSHPRHRRHMTPHLFSFEKYQIHFDLDDHFRPNHNGGIFLSAHH